MKSSVLPSWSTVSFVRDTPENIRLFVSYHLGIGAARMQLFFDDPNDPCIEMLAHLEQVTTYPCDPRFWKKTIKRGYPKRHGMRQNGAATAGYRAAKEDWVLHLDADEFLHGPLGEPTKCLEELPTGLTTLKLGSAERVIVSGREDQDYFRLPMSTEQVKAVHQEFAGNFIRRQGFFGHLQGKSFVRGGQDGVWLKPHWPMLNNRNLELHNVPATSQASILHRNAEPFEVWRRKLEFRLGTASVPGKSRFALRDMIEADDEVGLRDFYQRVFGLTLIQGAKMSAMRRLFTLERPLNRFVDQYFPTYATSLDRQIA